MPVITRSQHAAFVSALKNSREALVRHGNDAKFVKHFKETISHHEKVNKGRLTEDLFYWDLWMHKHDFICDDFMHYYFDLVINNFGAGTYGANVLEEDMLIMMYQSKMSPDFKVNYVIEGPYNAPQVVKVETFLWSGTRKRLKFRVKPPSPPLPDLEWDPSY